MEGLARKDMMTFFADVRGRWPAALVLVTVLLTASCTGKKEEAPETTPTGVNLLQNGSFEEVGEDGLPVGWKLVNFRGMDDDLPVQWEVDNSTAVDGVNSFLFKADFTTQRFYTLSQEVEVRGADRIRLKGWMQMEEVDRRPDQYAQCNFLLTFYDENHDRFQDMRFADKRTRVKQGTHLWFEENRTFRLPDGTRYVEVSCILGMSGRAWFDNVELSLPPSFDWETARTENFEFHWYPGHELPDSNRARQQAFFEFCERRLQVESDAVISYYYYPDSLTIRTALSLKGVQYVSWDDLEIHTINRNDFHETLHFITDAYGRPTRAISEGTVYWVRNNWGGYPVSKVGAYLMRMNQLARVPQFTDYSEFIKIPGAVTVPSAASFIDFLVQEWGTEKLMELYREVDGANNFPAFSRGFERVYEIPVADAEAQWRLKLELIDTSDMPK